MFYFVFILSLDVERRERVKILKGNLKLLRTKMLKKKKKMKMMRKKMR